MQAPACICSMRSSSKKSSPVQEYAKSRFTNRLLFCWKRVFVPYITFSLATLIGGLLRRRILRRSAAVLGIPRGAESRRDTPTLFQSIPSSYRGPARRLPLLRPCLLVLAVLLVPPPPPPGPSFAAVVAFTYTVPCCPFPVAHSFKLPPMCVI